MFSLRESVKIIQMYNPGYTISYSYLATAHHWAGDWCVLCERIREEHDNFAKEYNTPILNDKLSNILGRSSSYFLESKSQYEIAIQTYYTVLQMHAESNAYKSKIENIFSLEDDYNNNLAHFNLAVERNLVNTGKVRARIEKLQDRISGSKLYTYNHYTTI